MKSAPCRGCGQFGHWSKDAACPKNAGKAANIVGVSPVLVAEDATGAPTTAAACGEQ